MDDFLHRLRTGKDKRFDRSRRNYEQSQYRSADRQNAADRRKRGVYNKQPSSEQANTTLSRIMPTVKSLLETIAEDQKQLVQLEERKTAAVESIAVYLKKLSGYDGQPVPAAVDAGPEEKREAPRQNTAGNETETLTSDSPLQIIQKLRDEEGLSFEKIAKYLNENKIPTVSGRGKWRGQAVSKLYK